MAQYELRSFGVFDNVGAVLITPRDYAAWQAYIDWLAAGNVADPMPPPPEQYPTIVEKRAEALARLDGYAEERRRHSTVVALGHTWTVSERFLVLLLMHAASFPPVPPGFALPDVNRVQVPLTLADLKTLVDAISARVHAFNVRYAALVAIINASATPLAEDVTTGWPA